MKEVYSKMVPQLKCLELPTFAPDNLDLIRAAFRQADACVLGQAWLDVPEEDFTPATVRVGWRGNSLLVFAELEDADFFTHATAFNQRMWELGDTFEIFLQPMDSPRYVEFHVTSNNKRLQLNFANASALKQAKASDSFEELMLPDGVFHSLTWVQSEHRRWFVYADIPFGSVCGVDAALAGKQWRFSFSRYDYVRGRKAPIVSSSSPHAMLDFHRSQEWDVLHLIPARFTSKPRIGYEGWEIAKPSREKECVITQSFEEIKQTRKSSVR